jgi:hypothetical protein
MSPVAMPPISAQFVGSTAKSGFHKRPTYFLFGLIHGHYDVSASAVDGTGATGDDVLTAERVNTGIAIVVPFDRIEEVYKLSEAGSEPR